MYICMHIHIPPRSLRYDTFLSKALFHSTEASETSRAISPCESLWQFCWVQTFASMRFQRACYCKESVSSFWQKGFALWNCLFALNVFIHINFWVLKKLVRNKHVTDSNFDCRHKRSGCDLGIVQRVQNTFWWILFLDRWKFSTSIEMQVMWHLYLNMHNPNLFKWLHSSHCVLWLVKD